MGSVSTAFPLFVSPLSDASSAAVQPAGAAMGCCLGTPVLRWASGFLVCLSLLLRECWAPWKGGRLGGLGWQGSCVLQGSRDLYSGAQKEKTMEFRLRDVLRLFRAWVGRNGKKGDSICCQGSLGTLKGTLLRVWGLSVLPSQEEAEPPGWRDRHELGKVSLGKRGCGGCPGWSSLGP